MAIPAKFTSQGMRDAYKQGFTKGTRARRTLKGSPLTRGDLATMRRSGTARERAAYILGVRDGYKPRSTERFTRALDRGRGGSGRSSGS